MGHSPEDIRILKVAKLLEGGNKKQKEIAGLLDIDQSQVSKDKAFAIEKEWLEEYVLHLPSSLTEAELTEVLAVSNPNLEETEEQLRRLAMKSNTKASPKLHIVEAPADGSPELFGQRAAVIVADLIRRKKPHSCAVAWGRTLWSVLLGLKELSLEQRRNLLFLPISGDPLNLVDEGHSPSDIAANLSDLYQTSKRYSLHGVAARVPKILNKKAKTIRDFVRYCDAYLDLFGDENASGLMAELDMIFCGIGDAASSKNDPWYKEIKKMEGDERISRVAVGNIGGVWLPKNQLTIEEKRSVNGINSRWLGIRDEHFKQCAMNSLSRDMPGVVVIAKETKKLEILMSTVGMVNNYIISRSLFEALKKRLGVTG